MRKVLFLELLAGGVGGGDGELEVIPPVPGLLDEAVGGHEEHGDGGDDVGLAVGGDAREGPLEGDALLGVPAHDGELELGRGDEDLPAVDAALAEGLEVVVAL